ncbi:MAG: helix-turn-helix domain-containing protein [Bacteroidota bacterium]
MICQFIDPQGPPSPYIDQCFKLKFEAGEGSNKSLIVPDCTPGIVYVKAGSIQRGQDRFKEGDIFIFGQKSRSVEYQFGEHTQAYGCKLSPMALYHLFGIQAAEVTDDFIRLSDLLKEVDSLKLSLMQGEAKFALAIPAQETKTLTALLKAIHLSHGLISIKELRDTYNLSYKKMERLFKKCVGIPPKLYARIIRFNYSLKIGTEQFNLTELAYESGFFDQNHFIKEVKRFTQKPPSEVFHSQPTAYHQSHIQYLKNRKY